MESRDTIHPSFMSSLAAPYNPLNNYDDGVANDNLALDDDPLFPADWDQETPPYTENLYSTPLNWEPPINNDNRVDAVANPPFTLMRPLNTLTPAQHEKILSIAMPQHLQYRNQHSPNSTASNKSRSISSPDTQDHTEDRGRKRKSSSDQDDDEDADGDEHGPPVKKTAHNMIEKRYRTNLNDKIAALRDSVPSLRIMSKSSRGEDTADDREDLQGLTPAHKLNKATVLSKATEYINHLEKRNKRLMEENTDQKGRLAAFETLFRSGSMGYQPLAPVASPYQFGGSDYNTPGPSPGGMEARGMIQVPEDIRRLHSGQMNQQAFSVPQEQYAQARPVPNGWANSSAYLPYGKLMVGSLAGLMFLEGWREMELEDDSPGARGLFALPLQLLKQLSSTLHSSLDFTVAGYHVPSSTTLTYLKFVLVVGAILWAFVPAIVASKAKETTEKTATVSLKAAPSVASPIGVRQQAWHTAIQTVWVPRHNFFLEFSALFIKSFKLFILSLTGATWYAYLTGSTTQAEIARVKAWEIALDAQLGGGDAEVNKSRLTLTLLASGTLPNAPSRSMLKAVHVNVLLWEVGNAGFNGYSLFHEMASKLSQWQWASARRMQRNRALSNELPKNLVALLQLRSKEVFNDEISQRAYNLTWNYDSSHNIDTHIDSMDEVVHDHAIRSPLDAVAAWYSCLSLQRALCDSLSTTADSTITQQRIRDNITLAVVTAPIGSVAQLRAKVGYAVLVTEKRGASIDDALQCLADFEKNSVKLAPVRISDIKNTLSCIMAMAHIQRFPPPENPEPAHEHIAKVKATELSLLSFTASYQLMLAINAHELVATSCQSQLDSLAGALRVWVGGQDSAKSGFDKDAKRAVITQCLGIKRRIIGMVDDGYESMGDDGNESC